MPALYSGNSSRPQTPGFDRTSTPTGLRTWATTNSQKAGGREAVMSTDQIPIHPLRLCKEVRDFVQRDAILVVDGHEILNYARQSIPTYVPEASPQLGAIRHYGSRPAIRHRGKIRGPRTGRSSSSTETAPSDSTRWSWTRRSDSIFRC